MVTNRNIKSMIHMAAFSLNARNLNPLADHLSCSGKKVMLYEIVFYSCSSDKDSHYNPYSVFGMDHWLVA